LLTVTVPPLLSIGVRLRQLGADFFNFSASSLTVFSDFFGPGSRKRDGAKLIYSRTFTARFNNGFSGGTPFHSPGLFLIVTSRSPSACPRSFLLSGPVHRFDGVFAPFSLAFQVSGWFGNEPGAFFSPWSPPFLFAEVVPTVHVSVHPGGVSSFGRLDTFKPTFPPLVSLNTRPLVRFSHFSCLPRCGAFAFSFVLPA